MKKLLLILLFVAPVQATRMRDTTAVNAILNQNFLQSGATFYVSSGTVDGPLVVKGTMTAENYYGIVDSDYYKPHEMDFEKNSAGPFDIWLGASVGTGGTGSNGNGTKDHPGQIGYRSAAAVNTGYQFTTDVSAYQISGGEQTEFIWQTPAISTINVVRFGFFDSITTTLPTDAVMFSIMAASMTAQVWNNSVYYIAATTKTLQVSTWYHAKLTVAQSTTSGAMFEIWPCTSTVGGDGYWTETIVTNLPTAGGARSVGHGFMGYCTGGGTNFFVGAMDEMTLEIRRKLYR